MPGSSKKKRRSPVVSWFRKLRHASTPTKVEDSADEKQRHGIVRTGSVPAHPLIAPRWVPSLLRSYSEKRYPGALSANDLTRSMSSINNPLPLTAKNLQALNASQSFVASGCVYDVGDLRRHPAWKDLDADSSAASSSVSGEAKRKEDKSLSDIKEDDGIGSAAARCSSPERSQIAAHGVTNVVHAHAAVESLHIKHGVISQHIDHLMDSKPYGQSISQHVHALQNAVDMLALENVQLRHQLSNSDGQYRAGDTQGEKPVQSAINTVCVDLVKLQFEVRAKDQVIQKLKRQIATVQQLLDA